MSLSRLGEDGILMTFLKDGSLPWVDSKPWQGRWALSWKHV
jgi:hypothetical protein